MVWMVGIGPGFKHVIESQNAATVFWWTGILAGDVSGIPFPSLSLADIVDEEAMAPSVTEVIFVDHFETGCRQKIAQSGFGGVTTW